MATVREQLRRTTYLFSGIFLLAAAYCIYLVFMLWGVENELHSEGILAFAIVCIMTVFVATGSVLLFLKGWRMR